MDSRWTVLDDLDRLLLVSAIVASHELDGLVCESVFLFRAWLVSDLVVDRQHFIFEIEELSHDEQLFSQVVILDSVNLLPSGCGVDFSFLGS